MTKSRIVRGAKGVTIVAAGVLLTASVGSATAAPAPVSSAVQDVAIPAAGKPDVAVAEAVSWRGSVVAAGVIPGATATAQRPSRAASARQIQAVQFVKFTNFTLNSSATKDMRGVEASLYRGKYFTRASETKRLCIAHRESEGHYDVISPSGSYFGAYQVSRDLARGATWMMLKEHRKLMGDAAAKKVLAKLRVTPMNKWPRYWQDAAFHTVINWDHSLSGAAHWAGGRWHC
jgi:hypothetical protein